MGMARLILVRWLGGIPRLSLLILRSNLPIGALTILPIFWMIKDVNGGRKVRRGHECDVAVQKCGIFINLKHVLQYGKLGRDSQESVGGRGESAGDSPGDGDALENLEEDSGA